MPQTTSTQYFFGMPYSSLNSYHTGLGVRTFGTDTITRHWGQVVVFPPGTLQVHHKEMDSVPAMNPPGTLQIHFEFPTQFTSDDPSWDMHSTLTVFQVM